jgi:hypothetical protein
MCLQVVAWYRIPTVSYAYVLASWRQLNCQLSTRGILVVTDCPLVLLAVASAGVPYIRSVRTRDP